MKSSTITRLSPRQQVLRDCLGENYTQKWIDGETVIYRDLGDYDIEISGGHGRSQRVGVYVWEKRAGWPILVEQHPHLPQDHGMLKRLLEDISERYMKKEDKQNA